MGTASSVRRAGGRVLFLILFGQEVTNVSHRSPLHTNPELRPAAGGKIQSAMSRRIRSSERLAAIFLVCGSIITATPIPASAQPRDRVVAEVLELHIGREAERGRVPSHRVLTGTLGAGESESVRVHTCSGMEYEAVGICDPDCSDLDLTAYNATAEVMDSDVLLDDVPIVHFTPAACGFTTLSVEMVECNGSCEWAVQLFIDDPAAPSGVSGAENGEALTWSSDWDAYLGTYRGAWGDTTILRHENRLMVLLPLSQQQNGATGVLRPADSAHVFRLESDGSSAGGEKVRFVVNGSGAATAVFVAGQESRRVE